MFVIFLVISTNIVFDLSFQFLLIFFASSNFFKCLFVKSHFSTTSFGGCQIHFHKFSFLSFTMFVAFVKKI